MQAEEGKCSRSSSCSRAQQQPTRRVRQTCRGGLDRPAELVAALAVAQTRRPSFQPQGE